MSFRKVFPGRGVSCRGNGVPEDMSDVVEFYSYPCTGYAWVDFWIVGE